LKQFFVRIKNRIKAIQLKIYDRVIGDRMMLVPFEVQVKLARRLSIGPMPLVRSNVLKTMPDNIRAYLKQGKTGAEIKEMYWSCKEFREWWELLCLQEDRLDSIIRNTISGGESYRECKY
jgi:hypothetical protein